LWLAILILLQDEIKKGSAKEGEAGEVPSEKKQEQWVTWEERKGSRGSERKRFEDYIYIYGKATVVSLVFEEKFKEMHACAVSADACPSFRQVNSTVREHFYLDTEMNLVFRFLKSVVFEIPSSFFRFFFSLFLSLPISISVLQLGVSKSRLKNNMKLIKSNVFWISFLLFFLSNFG